MNRAARRLRLFECADDYQLFVSCLARGLHEVPVRLLAYCVMPNHFHLVVWPRETGQLSQFMKWVTGTHGQRWHQVRGTIGGGCVYQGRYRAVPVQQDAHLFAVLRYVERNPLRARLVDRAEDWPWSSLAQRCTNHNAVPLQTWPIPQPEHWLVRVNERQAEHECTAIRRATERGTGIGSELWQQTIPGPRARGRPKKGVGSIFREPTEKSTRPLF